VSVALTETGEVTVVVAEVDTALLGFGSVRHLGKKRHGSHYQLSWAGSQI
jgi:hypothetical protein